MTTIATSSPSPRELALDATKVYWTWNGGLSWAKKDGSGSAVLSTGGVGAGVALDAQYAYWGSHSSAGQGDLLRVPLQGGTTVPIASPGYVGDIVLDSTTAYFGLDTSPAPISKVALTGGQVDPITPVQNGTVADLAADGTNFYWLVDAIAGAVRKMPMIGGTIVDLATNLDPLRMVIDATDAFVIRRNVNSYALDRISLSGGPATPMTTGELWAVAVDSKYVYFAQNILSKASLRRMPKQGGPVEVLYTQTNNSTIYQLVVDDTSIYYINQSPPEIRKLTPK